MQTLAEAAWEHYAERHALGLTWTCPLCGESMPRLNLLSAEHARTVHPIPTRSLTTLDQLARIPTLAAEVFLTWGHPNPSGQANNARGGSPAPKAPADLAAWDALRPDEGGLLFELTQAIRAVWEDQREAVTLPDLDNPPTWTGECRWLTETASVWQADQWLLEYVTDQVQLVHRELDRTARTPPPLHPTCPRCRFPVHLDKSGAFYRCEAGHVVDHHAEIERMGRIQEMTATELAQHFGVTDRTLRRWRAASLVVPVGKIGREPVYSVEDVRRARERIWSGSATRR